MKTLILTTLSLLLSVSTIAQVFIIGVSKINTFAHPENVDPFNAIKYKTWDTTEIVDTKYVLDFEKGVSKFYKNNLLISNLKFQDTIKKGDTYYITLLDYDLNNPSDYFNTYIIINPKKNLFMFYWYDDVWNFTKVEMSDNPIITIMP
jgi:hypothetical protein